MPELTFKGGGNQAQGQIEVAGYLTRHPKGKPSGSNIKLNSITLAQSLLSVLARPNPTGHVLRIQRVRAPLVILDTL